MEIRTFYIVNHDNKEELLEGDSFTFGFEVFENKETIVLEKEVQVEKIIEVTKFEKTSFLESIINFFKWLFGD